ncbi:MAG: SDR family oxidoreductase [Dyella sp.]|uniref:SDR family oxidoreductase n=1 Tax=Dyella sp. TaxID=1869338 RepID=UPI003F7DB618
MKQVIVITGASSGFGWMSAIALARAGHAVYAGMRETAGRNAAAVQRLQQVVAAEGLDLHAIEMDIADQSSVDAAIEAILAVQGRLDVVVHNAGHMAYGPAEAFTPEQFAALYDTNVLGTQRVNRAVLPHLRARGRGLLLWVSSSSTRGGTPPYLAPYFAAKAGMDALAVSYAGELARWGIESSIVVPGAFTQGTNHFAHAGQPSDAAVAKAYADGPTADLADVALRGLAALEPADADPQAVAAAIVGVVDAPYGRRPFRVHVDPAQDGAEVVNGMADRERAELLRRIGLGDLLHPRVEA